LLPLLEAAAKARPRLKVACSLRDILVAKPDAKRNSEMLELARRHFDAVLVHGDPRLVRLEESFPPAAALGDLLRYTGYVAAKLEGRAAAHGEVAVSAGGGAVGMGLLSAALAARGLSTLADAPWRLIAGPGLPEADYRRLAEALPPGVALERFRADFPHYLSGARFSVSQAGYNTVMDLLQTQIPAVVVPFAEAAETEQSLRAQILAKRGLLGVVEAIDLTPTTLARAIDQRLADTDRRWRFRAPVAVDGADRSAAILKEMMGR
jgi:predicted glycosyltransferase